MVFTISYDGGIKKEFFFREGISLVFQGFSRGERQRALSDGAYAGHVRYIPAPLLEDHRKLGIFRLKHQIGPGSLRPRLLPLLGP